MGYSLVHLLVIPMLCAVTCDFPERCKICKFKKAGANHDGGFCACQRRGYVWDPITGEQVRISPDTQPDWR